MIDVFLDADPSESIDNLLPNLIRPVEQIANSFGLSHVKCKPGFRYGQNDQLGGYNMDEDAIEIGVPRDVFEAALSKKIDDNPQILIFLQEELKTQLEKKLQRIEFDIEEDKVNEDKDFNEYQLNEINTAINEVKSLCDGKIKFESISKETRNVVFPELEYRVRGATESALLKERHKTGGAADEVKNSRLAEIGIGILAGIESFDEYFETNSDVIRHEVVHSMLCKTNIFPHYSKDEIKKLNEMRSLNNLPYIGKFNEEFPNALPELKINTEVKFDDVTDIDSFCKIYKEFSDYSGLNFATTIYGLKKEGATPEELRGVFHIAYEAGLQELYLVVDEVIAFKREYVLRDFLERFGSYTSESKCLMPDLDTMSSVFSDLEDKNNWTSALEKLKELMKYENFEKYYNESYVPVWMRGKRIIE